MPVCNGDKALLACIEQAARPIMPRCVLQRFFGDPDPW